MGTHSFPLSASYSFYIPEFHVSFSNNLPPSSSFTAECCAVLEALRFISNAAPNNYLIASDYSNRLIQLLWVPGHVGMYGNEMADSLDKSSLISFFLLSLLYLRPILPLYYIVTLPVSGPTTGITCQLTLLPNINLLSLPFLKKNLTIVRLTWA
ncbi:RNase H domain-containing protein [Aphis craccivora]|uniref:RNase H domain-containing protein n=1 Tax=Aphis craccivora TaxID=307492 RepID=A0A6G0VPL5_APHCR|nr:RNase H domain-containing protein [Aphis craccivora]